MDKSFNGGVILEPLLKICFLLLFVALYAVSPAIATDVTGPMVINTPGTYVLTTDILECGQLHCIEITASDVIFDGNGHMIDGLSTAGSSAVYVHNSSVMLSNVSVQNFVAHDWGYGTNYQQVTDGSIEGTVCGVTVQTGIYLLETAKTSVSGNNAAGGFRGIHLDHSDENRLSDNSCNGTENRGMYLFYSDGNYLTGNHADGVSDDAIYLFYSNNNALTGNFASFNTDDSGIRLHSSNNNLIAGNVMDANTWGIRLYASGDNQVFLNDFQSNTVNAYVTSSPENIWNSSIPLEYSFKDSDYLGNFWSDYTGSDLNGDRIGDTPYPIGDAHPLMSSFTTYTTPVGGPAVINNPGFYSLVQDVDDCDESSFIRICSSDVIFNGNMYRIDGTGFTNTAIWVGDSGGGALYTVSVKNCRFHEWGTGVIYRSVYEGEIRTILTEYVSKGVILLDTSKVVVRNCSFTMGDYGALLLSSDENQVEGNYGDNTTFLFFLSSSANNVLTGNEAADNNCGVYLTQSSGNSVVGNSFQNNGYGVVFYGSSSNYCYNNRLINSFTGIIFNSEYEPSDENYIFNNYLKNSNNVAFVSDNQPYNRWNTTKFATKNIIGGPFIGGNYWASPDGLGFSETCNDADLDGICDAPFAFAIDNNNIDLLPLKEFPADLIPVTGCTLIDTPGHYVLVDDILNSTASSCIMIRSPDVLFEGCDHTIDGVDAPMTRGISVRGSDNVTVMDLILTDWDYGLFLIEYSDEGRFENLTVTGNDRGIIIQEDSNDNVVEHCTITANRQGIDIGYASRTSIKGSLVSNNTESGIQLYSGSVYIEGNTIENNSIGGIYLEWSSNFLIHDNRISNNGQNGISLTRTHDGSISGNNLHENQNIGLLDLQGHNNTISQNNVSRSEEGIRLSESDYDWVHDNVIKPNDVYGIELISSNFSRIENNVIGEGNSGISMRYCRGNLVRDNIIADCNEAGAGILLNNTELTTITGNSIIDNEYGLSLSDSQANTISNNALNNSMNIHLLSGQGMANIWNISEIAGRNIAGGCMLGGNYWADPYGTGFSQVCTDADYDGFCDDPLILDENNMDLLALHAVLQGDLNNNGVIDWGDVVKCAYMSWGLIEPNPCADYNDNGAVDWGDVVKLAYYYWELIPEL